jgi:hypothetical protein
VSVMRKSSAIVDDVTGLPQFASVVYLITPVRRHLAAPNVDTPPSYLTA